MKIIIKAIIIGLLSPLLAVAQPPTVTATLSVDTIWIGDQANLDLIIDKDIATEIGVPQPKEGKLTEKIEVVGNVSLDTLSQKDRRVQLRARYAITSFDMGTYTLSGLPIVIMENQKATDTIQSLETLHLVVRTFEIDTTKQQIFDIKEPLNTPLQFDEIKELLIWGSIAAVPLAIIIFFVVRWLRNRHKKLYGKPMDPPHVTAIAALIALKHKKLWQQGKIKEYHSAVSTILRYYIEGRYNIGAPEMTTPEIVSALKATLTARELDTLQDVLSLSDLVKFAKWAPEAEQNEEMHDIAYNFIEQTKLIETTDEQD